MRANVMIALVTLAVLGTGYAVVSKSMQREAAREATLLPSTPPSTETTDTSAAKKSQTQLEGLFGPSGGENEASQAASSTNLGPGAAGFVGWWKGPTTMGGVSSILLKADGSFSRRRYGSRIDGDNWRVTEKQAPTGRVTVIRMVVTMHDIAKRRFEDQTDLEVIDEKTLDWDGEILNKQPA